MSANLFMIYQINDLVKSRDYRCRPYEYQIENGFMVTSENYVLGYKASLIQGVTPGQIENSISFRRNGNQSLCTVFSQRWKTASKKS